MKDGDVLCSQAVMGKCTPAPGCHIGCAEFSPAARMDGPGEIIVERVDGEWLVRTTAGDVLHRAGAQEGAESYAREPWRHPDFMEYVAYTGGTVLPYRVIPPPSV